MQERTHQAKMVTIILDQIGPGQNRCLAFSTFTFKQGQNTNQSFPVHPIHIHNAFKLNVIYSIHSGDGIHSFLANKVFLGTIEL